MKSLLRPCLMLLPLLAPGWASAQPAGPVRGVQFLCLDGYDQGLGVVLSTQDDPVVKGRLDTLFDAYRAANVNWIRVIVSPNHFPGEPFPIPVNGPRIAQLRAFMTNPRAAGFRFEVIAGGPFCANSTMCLDPPGTLPRTTKENFRNWAEGLRDLWNTSETPSGPVGMISIGGDLLPCLWNGAAVKCEGDSGNDVPPLVVNHGKWIRAMWSWARSEFPNLNLTYEVIGSSPDPTNQQVTRVADWVAHKTPDIGAVSMSMYMWQQAAMPQTSYEQFAHDMLVAYAAAPTGKPLWIDEYGFSIGPGAPTTTETNQDDFYAGFLRAVVCERPANVTLAGLFAWTTANDYPFGGKWYGLASGFAPLGSPGSPEYPVWRPAWSRVSYYYTLAQCP